jgi:hypothetical protein
MARCTVVTLAELQCCMPGVAHPLSSRLCVDASETDDAVLSGST